MGGTGIHPVTAFKFRGHALDRTLHPEGLAASDAAEGVLFLQDPRWRRGRAKINPGYQRDDIFGTRRLADPALHAGVFDEP